jgi:structure-specific recognition protein 1
LFQVFVDLIQTCSKISIIHPGNNFKSKDGQPCVKCNVKAQPGWLYLLKQSLIFILKPVIYFKTDEIRNIEFTRTSATSKQFDMKIILKDDKKGVEFMGI